MNTTLITKGQKNQLNRIVMEDGLLKNNLTLDEAQELLKHGDILRKAILSAKTDIIRTYLYADREVKLNDAYPPEYKTYMPVREQVETLLAYPAFENLNATWVLTKGQQWYDSLRNLPDWIEGPLVYVWWEAFGSYVSALDTIVSAIGNSRKFKNCMSGFSEENIRQTQRTAGMERNLKKHQPGDFIVVPSQAGIRYAGKAVCRSRVLFEDREFGLGAVAEGCRALTQPDRHINWDELHPDCSGDECKPSGDDDSFSESPYFVFSGGGLRFGTGGVSFASGGFGSASAFVPQQ